jgi:hypothetical protein
MVYRADLTQTGEVIAVGYLARGHSFPKGKVSEAFFHRLVALAKEPLSFSCGYHTCDVGWCSLSLGGEHPKFRYEGDVISVGSTDILVPDNEVVYEVPSLILHYIRHHKYVPPACFVQAVLECPDPGSPKYIAAIKSVASEMAQFLWPPECTTDKDARSEKLR